MRRFFWGDGLLNRGRKHESAVEFGDIRVSLERAGTPIGPLDLLIAAHARALQLTLLTSNLKDFSRVSNLRVEDWSDP